jgi:hypothetical protein
MGNGDWRLEAWGLWEGGLNQTIQDWYTFRVARAVRASLHPLLFVRMAHATREGRCKVCTNVMWFDLVSSPQPLRPTDYFFNFCLLIFAFCLLICFFSRGIL